MRNLVVGGLVCLMAVSAFSGTAKKPRTPDLRFGVLSDSQVYWKRKDPAQYVRIAFEHFRDCDVDAVLFAGDIGDTGRMEELMAVADAFRAVFPGDRGRDGRPVQKLFVSGNHDLNWCGTAQEKIDKLTDEERRGIITYDNLAQSWERAFGEKYEPIWLKTVKGYAFIGVNYDRRVENLAKLEGFLKANASRLGKTKPFFCVQHRHPKDTCIGAWAWGHDKGESTAAYSAYPNAVVFSGHSHYSLTDERSLWQGAFTSINTAAICYMSGDYALRENFDGNGSGYHGEKRKHVKEGVGRISQYDNKHCMVVSVHGTKGLVIERYDVYEKKPIGDNWVVRIPGGEDAGFAARAAKRSAPAFAPDAKVSVKVDKDLVRLTFPSAHAVNKCRVYEYELTATLIEDDVDLVQAQRRMMALDAFRPEEHPGEETPFAFARDELPMKGHYRFSVRPLECFGKKGEAIVSETVEI